MQHRKTGNRASVIYGTIESSQTSYHLEEMGQQKKKSWRNNGWKYFKFDPDMRSSQYIITKLSKSKTLKKKILKSASEKKRNTNFSSETIQTGRQKVGIF